MGDFRLAKVAKGGIFNKEEYFEKRNDIISKTPFGSKIGPYLDNFVTNPMHILPYSCDSDLKSPEYAKKV